MLTLTRKAGEAFSLYGEVGGERIELAIMVVDIGGGRVQLGFEAPKWLNIEREEISKPTESLSLAREAHNRRSGCVR